MNIDSFSYLNIDYEIHIVTNKLKDEVEAYCQKCKADRIENNTSFKKLKIGRFDQERWWCVLDKKKKKIVSLAGAHHCPEISEGTFRIMFRAGTILEYRGKAGPPSKIQKSCFAWGRMLPHHVKFCLQNGAREIVFTTNTDKDGTSSSNKQDRICHLVFEKEGMAKKIKTMSLFGVKQNIWKVLIHNVYDKRKIAFSSS